MPPGGRRWPMSWGGAVAAVGCAWLTLRVYETGEGGPSDAELGRRHLAAAEGQCTVIVDPVGDGRLAVRRRHAPGSGERAN